MSTSTGKVEIHRFGKLSSCEGSEPLPASWPVGQALLDMIMMKGGAAANNEDDDTSVGISRSIEPPSTSPPADYWQLSARWALLNKYQLLEKSLSDPYVIVTGPNDNNLTKLVFSKEHEALIQSTWKDLLESDCKKDDEHKNYYSELKELIETSCSNSRSLEWAVMDIGPGCQFRLHAHPNIELVYCIEGALHEVRMNGEPYNVSTNTTDNNKPLSLTDCNRSWSFQTLRQGKWLVNEVGSIHKSFTATNHSGCKLLVLWGGGHLDIPEGQEPTSVDVHGAVRAIDQHLATTAAAGCECSSSTDEWNSIQETFLPQSDRSQKK